MASEKKTINVLVVDDDENYLDIYGQALSHGLQIGGQTRSQTRSAFAFSVLRAKQGKEALSIVKRLRKGKNPVAVGFIDIKLPPGPDGIWLAKEIRKTDHNMELVMVTGYSESADHLMAEEILPPDKIIFVQKPLHIREICYFAYSLSTKWQNTRKLLHLMEHLESQVVQKTEDLTRKNRELELESLERKKAEEALKKMNEVLETRIHERTNDLEETNIALRILLEHRDRDKNAVGKNMLGHIKQMVFPFLERLKNTPLSPNQKRLLAQVEDNLNQVVSPFVGNLHEAYHNLSPSEMKVAKLVADGKSNKEIAELLGVSKGTILTHRHKLRAKLGLKNKKINLRSHLSSFI